MLPAVSIILVNWNKSAHTLECLDSLRASTYSRRHIIVVDNGSTGDSVKQLRLASERFTLLENGDNLGFTGGNNRGIRHALEQGSQYIFLLNNDTVVAPDAIDQLVHVAEVNPTVGILSPKILFFEPPHQIWFGGSEYNRRYLTSRMIGYTQEDKGQCDEQRDVPFVSGCAMFIRRDVIEKIGLLCEDFFFEKEDLDYSLRASLFGYRLRYVPGAVVWHKESISAGGHDAPMNVYYRTRNFSILRQRWTKGFTHSFVSGGRTLLYLSKYGFQLARGGQWRSIIGMVYGIRDGLLGRTGRREYAVLRIE